MDTARLREHLKATHQARQGELVPAPQRALTPTSDALDTAESYAERLSKSILLPAHYRRQPANILWAIEFGRMLNIPAMAAMTGVFVIEGRPSASAALIGMLVRRAGHKLRIRGGTSWKEPAFAEIIRKDDPEFTFRADWPFARALESQLVRLVNNRPYARDKKYDRALPWERYTPALLKARAITEVARDACQDALFGLLYTPEELGAEVDQEGRPTGQLLDVADGAGYHFADAPTIDEAMERARTGALQEPAAPEPAEADRDRVVVTSPAETDGSEEPGAEDEALNAEPIDWEQALSDAAEGGVDELRDLWWVVRRAEPVNEQLLTRISDAVKATENRQETAGEN
ncbi:hypothetical protein [Amycolatopsis sp. RTGN1]|uniref:hypothetical protein n=1 Tax=Amycolatopsis ponsaeliensis TaxID=2992142 RepID=UPI00254B7D12|nr:hypothetical protein [Amycolatopsis sp. RTGN1]